MSELLTFTGGATATIYGSLDGAASYLCAQYENWDAVNADPDPDQALWKLLVRARRYLDRLSWADDYADFATRDALDLGTDDGDAAFPFRAASYELANLALSDESVLTVSDQGSNIQSVGAGGASVTYFAPTSAQRGTASLLPPVLMKLVGPYLATSGGSIGAEGGTSSTGSCVNPFGPARDFDRSEGW